MPISLKIFSITAALLALALYRKQDWDGAEAAFHACLEAIPADQPESGHAGSVVAFRQTPPEPGWDGFG